MKGKAPVVIIDPTILGDRRPRDNDALAKLREGNKALRDKNRLPNQVLLENHEAAAGEAMVPTEFIRRLQKMHPALIIKPGGIANAVSVRISVPDFDPDSETYMKVVDKPLACGFYTDKMMPEFSSYVNDKDGIPTREIRGWRTVLLRLIHAGVVDYPTVKAHFGEPLGQRGILWMEQMQQRRA